MPTAPFVAASRDDLEAYGRPFITGGTEPWNIPGVGIGGVGTLAVSLGTDYYSPFYVDTPIVVSVLGTEVTTGAAGNMRIGIYRANRHCQPIGAPLADSGNLDTTSPAVKTYTPGTPLYLQRGRYLTIHNQSANITLRNATVFGDFYNVLRDTIGTSSVLQQRKFTRTYAAFTTPGSEWNDPSYSGSSSYEVFLRISKP
jgi:hypothetical protein